MANVDFGRYRRIVQMFWDPEPTNDSTLDQPAWCLGRSYRLASSSSSKAVFTKRKTQTDVYTDPELSSRTPPSADEEIKSIPPSTTDSTFTPPDSISGSFSSSSAYDEIERENGWPQGFIDDFGSRFWMTYRSEFEAIRKSKDPHAVAALSLSMRIKSQLGDQGGFVSDSGWGCMIRSGQSLLANTMAMLRLGRGADYVIFYLRMMKEYAASND